MRIICATVIQQIQREPGFRQTSSQSPILIHSVNMKMTFASLASQSPVLLYSMLLSMPRHAIFWCCSVRPSQSGVQFGQNCKSVFTTLQSRVQYVYNSKSVSSRPRLSFRSKSVSSRSSSARIACCRPSVAGLCLWNPVTDMFS